MQIASNTFVLVSYNRSNLSATAAGSIVAVPSSNGVPFTSPITLLINKCTALRLAAFITAIVENRHATAIFAVPSAIYSRYPPVTRIAPRRSPTRNRHTKKDAPSPMLQLLALEAWCRCDGHGFDDALTVASYSGDVIMGFHVCDDRQGFSTADFSPYLGRCGNAYFDSDLTHLAVHPATGLVFSTPPVGDFCAQVTVGSGVYFDEFGFLPEAVTKRPIALPFRGKIVAARVWGRAVQDVGALLEMKAPGGAGHVVLDGSEVGEALLRRVADLRRGRRVDWTMREELDYRQSGHRRPTCSPPPTSAGIYLTPPTNSISAHLAHLRLAQRPTTAAARPAQEREQQLHRRAPVDGMVRSSLESGEASGYSHFAYYPNESASNNGELPAAICNFVDYVYWEQPSGAVLRFLRFSLPTQN
ncbi:hypothetical protein DFJ73DRAFT_940543 [Zopfochytrium polystomum]|nr:hypothetical protein DFJ73DRAFT_940543 [Zopfochytrium polystomum]